MTPQEKLKEIKDKRKSEDDIWLTSEDEGWLIARIEQLEATLKDIADIEYPKTPGIQSAREALHTGPKPE